MSTLTERLDEAVKERLDGNWAELARRTALTPSTLQQVKKGADPRASTLLRIADALDVSLEWLMRGVLPMGRQGGVGAAGGELSGLAEVERKKATELFAKLGLGRLALEAHRGSFHSWLQTGLALQRASAGVMTLEDLVAAVRQDAPEVTEVDVAANVLHFIDQGLVRPEGAGIRVTQKVIDIELLDPAGVRSQQMEALQQLAEIIATGTDPQHIHQQVILAKAGVTTGTGVELMGQIVSQVKTSLVMAPQDNSGDEVTIVLGLLVAKHPD